MEDNKTIICQDDNEIANIYRDSEPDEATHKKFL